MLKRFTFLIATSLLSANTAAAERNIATVAFVEGCKLAFQPEAERKESSPEVYEQASACLIAIDAALDIATYAREPTATEHSICIPGPETKEEIIKVLENPGKLLMDRRRQVLAKIIELTDKYPNHYYGLRPSQVVVKAIVFRYKCNG